MKFASYISGFVDGEGCFLISFSKRDKLQTGIEVRPSFSVSQDERNLHLIKDIKSFFECGSIRYSKNDSNYKYEVRSLADLQKKINPHFEKYPLRSSKKEDFTNFRRVCNLMSKRRHCEFSGMKKIIELAMSMNLSGNRKYNKGKLLKILSKMKV